jgi:hypothetical protein
LIVIIIILIFSEITANLDKKTAKNDIYHLIFDIFVHHAQVLRQQTLQVSVFLGFGSFSPQ